MGERVSGEWIRASEWMVICFEHNVESQCEVMMRVIRRLQLGIKVSLVD